MKEVVNYSTNAFARCADSAKGAENEDAAALSLYLHVIEMIDGAEVLISQCCSVPAIPLLRSSFEALLSLQYLFETQEEYVRRSLSWLADYIRRQIALHEMMDPSTPRGKQYQRTAENDEIVREIEMPPVEGARPEASNLRDVLATPQFEPIVKESQRLTKAEHRRPNWYHLFGGPGNLQQLAQRLKRGAIYEIVYRKWSSVSHANDLSRVVTGEGRLRDPAQLREVMPYAPSFLFSATQLMIRKFRPGEFGSLQRWYLREVQADFQMMYKRS